MNKVILYTGLVLFASISLSAQDSKSRIAELKSEYKAKSRQMRLEYDEKRKLAEDSQQDELEETYWKNRLQMKREKKRIKRELKADATYQYILSDAPSLELTVIEEPAVELDPVDIPAPIGDDVTYNLLASAQEHIGVPYRYGGTDEKGFDCSGFVQHVFSRSGYSVPRTSQEQSKSGEKISIKKVRPGDLLFFSHRGSRIDHVGIVTDSRNGKLEMIHSSSSQGIIITDVNSSTYWKPRLKKARRIS